MALLVSQIFGLSATDTDTMRLHEAVQLEDITQFLKDTRKELYDHIERKHWKIVPLKCVPKGRTCLPMVWFTKRKRNPITEVIKRKARLCAGGHRSKEFVNYWDTYSSAVSWQKIMMIFTLSIVNDLHIRSIGFVMDFPQADIKTDIDMKPPTVPAGFHIPYLPQPLNRFKYVYKLIKNIYGLMDAVRTWNHHLHK